MSQHFPHKLCILGCGGFIGSHLVPRLLDEDRYDLYGLDITSAKIEEHLAHSRFHFYEVNVYDTRRVRELVEECDTVISLVALCNPSLYNTIPLEVIDINFTRPLEIVKMCVELGKRLIHFSTSEVYGKTVQGIADGALRNPEDPAHFLLKEDSSQLILGPISAQRWSYAAAKQLLERVIYAYGMEGRLDYTIVRPLNFVGPRMDYLPGIDGEGIPRVFACFVDALLFDKPLKLVDGGQSRRTFTAIDDAVDAIVRIVDRPDAAHNQIFNVGNPDNEVTIAQLAQMMIDIYHRLRPEFEGNPCRTVYESAEEFYGEGYEDCDRRVPDISKARELLGWEPKIGLEEALTTAMASFIEYYAVERAVG